MNSLEKYLQEKEQKEHFINKKLKKIEKEYQKPSLSDHKTKSSKF